MAGSLLLGALTASAAPVDHGSDDTALTPAELKATVAARAAARDEGFWLSSIQSFGNGILEVFVEDAIGLGAGSFTVQTGPDHPAGPGHNVLFGDGIPGTSYLQIRDVDLGVDYVQGQLLTHPSQRPLDSVAPVISDIDDGVRVTWHLGGDPHFVQDIVLHGSTQADTRVEVTTTIHDTFLATGGEYEVQYLWDVALGGDDGPALQPRPANTVFNPFDPVITTEYELLLLDDHLVVVDNDANPEVPSLAYGATISGPIDLVDGPMPDSMSYVCWPDAIFARLGTYQLDTSRDVSTPDATCTGPLGGNDSALLYHWSSLDVPPGGSRTVTASLFASPAEPHATSIAARAIVANLPGFRATLRDTVHDQPVPGRTVEFVIGNTVRCTAVTNSNGVAGCGTLSDTIAAILAGRYTARYTGGAIWAPSSDVGRLL